VGLPTAAGWAVGASTAHSPLPMWPAYLLGVVGLGGFYVLFAPLVRLRPFRNLVVGPAALLDECIRLGRETRDHIIYNGLDEWEWAREAATWTLQTANGLHDGFPACADEFLLASGDAANFSGQALVINTLNAKMSVLKEARKGLGN
jgi:hypothetical protein